MRFPCLALAVALLLAAPAARGQAFVGSTVSIFEATSEGVIPEEPDEVVVASVAVPAKYRGKKSFLLVTASVQESCVGTGTRSYLTIDGVEATPAVGPTECTDSGWAFRNRQWSFPPASQGGPAIAPGALVELRLRAFDAGAAFGVRTLRVEIAN
jgi:hypothetical protein